MLSTCAAWRSLRLSTPRKSILISRRTIKSGPIARTIWPAGRMNTNSIFGKIVLDDPSVFSKVVLRKPDSPLRPHRRSVPITESTHSKASLAQPLIA